ncbi:MAG: hypothetical protein U0X73_07935 [Thermoanaerobaculia bacterium]
MRVLLDESLPEELAAELSLPDAHTVRQFGWTGLKNGDLLGRARDAGFHVFLTADQGLPFQQNLTSFGLAVIVLRGRTNRIEDLRPLIPQIRQALGIVSPGQYLRLGG